MSNKIPTTEELFNQYSNLYQFEEGDPEYLVDKEDFKSSVIEFAKLHVERALEAANNLSKSIDIIFAEGDPLLSVYPVENIK